MRRDGHDREGQIAREGPRGWRLYVITDEALSRGRSHAQIATAALAGGADAIQLRDKTASTRRLLDAALAVREAALRAGRAFIVNDRLDIALAAGADGLHVGQDDLPACEARRLLGPGKILGVSASTVEEARAAEREGADYLGVGAIFEARSTKADAGAPRGLAILEEIRAAVSIPILAIGGITAENAAQAIRAGATGVAAISAVVGAGDIALAARVLRQRVVDAIG